LARRNPGTFGGLQNRLSTTQWEREVEYWVNIELATLQQQFVQFATGPVNTSGLLVKGPEEAELVCGSQLIKHPDFKNYRRSFFISLAAIGGFLVLAPWVFFKLVNIFGRRRRSEAIMEWISYGDLQLLRMANEGAGVEGWEGCDDETPFSKAVEVARIVHLSSSPADDELTGSTAGPHPRMKYAPGSGTTVSHRVTEVSPSRDMKREGSLTPSSHKVLGQASSPIS
jgi:hypothetical protein